MQYITQLERNKKQANCCEVNLQNILMLPWMLLCHRQDTSGQVLLGASKRNVSVRFADFFSEALLSMVLIVREGNIASDFLSVIRKNWSIKLSTSPLAVLLRF